jgi:hypothetical protein
MEATGQRCFPDLVTNRPSPGGKEPDMLPSNPRSNQNLSEAQGFLKPGVAFVAIIFCALVAFEAFNYTTTDTALHDLLGDIRFAGVFWSTILALAFCGIDFAGIARLFTPEQGADEPKEIWYLFAAWLIAATMNAVLTWWGVSMAVVNHNFQSGSVVDPKTITSVIPVFVAIMVWVIRILIIGTLSLAVDRLMHPGAQQRTAFQSAVASVKSMAPARERIPVQTPLSNAGGYNTPSPQSHPVIPRAAAPQNGETGRAVSEPTVHNLSMSARPRSGDGSGTHGHRS